VPWDRAYPSFGPATLLILAVFLFRVGYLIWWCPLELAGDEAYYWEQSRHLELCYNEKGPALPWLIAGCCRVFGDHEWSVRLTMAVSSALAAWVVGRLAMAVSRGDQRVGFYAVVCFCLMPAFQANAQICTQDGPLILIWAVLTAIGLRLFRRWQAGEQTWGQWLLLYAVMGIGILFKQSMPLFFAGMAVFAALQWRKLAWGWTLAAQQLAGIAVLGIIISPMIVWNQRHGWPMLEHTLGHLGVGGDQSGEAHSGNPILWLGATLGGIVGSFGPAAIGLMIWGSVAAWRDYQRRPEDIDSLWLMCAAWPGVLFFVVLSLFKPVVPSWPLPSLVPLVILVARLCAMELPRYEALVRVWASSASSGRSPRPETAFHKTWTVLVAYGIGGWALICFPNMLTHLPILGKTVEKSLMRRISGHRQAAANLERALNTIESQGRPVPIIVARYYMRASLMCFYLPGHPSVLTADKYLGKRSTNFDHWDDTRLDNPALFGRDVLFIGESDIAWEKIFSFEGRESVGGGRYFLGTHFQGPRPDDPRLLPRLP
jgi:hypothetical protein